MPKPKMILAFYCGRCPNIEAAAHRQVRHLREMGWRIAHSGALLCPECATDRPDLIHPAFNEPTPSALAINPPKHRPTTKRKAPK